MLILGPTAVPCQVVVDFAKGASGFRLFAAMVEDDLVITSNPAKFASPVGGLFSPLTLWGILDHMLGCASDSRRKHFSTLREGNDAFSWFPGLWGFCSFVSVSFPLQEGAAMPKVANYFVRPEGVTLSASTVKDVQYGEELR